MEGAGNKNGSVCVIQTAAGSRGIFHGDNPFNYSGPVLMAQIILSSLLTAILQYFLTPLGQTAFISQTLVGVALGPLFLGKIRVFQEKVFPTFSFYITETFAYFGLMLFLFLVGVKGDLTIIRKSGKRSIIIGLCNFFIPLALNEALALLLLKSVPMDPPLQRSVAWIGSFQCLNSFYVIVCLLGDLNLLNSELGRLAVSASMISGTCSWLWTIIIFLAKQDFKAGKKQMIVLTALVTACLILVITYIFRPLMLWMVKRTEEEKSVKESYIVSIFVMILGCSMFGEIIGQNFLIGPMLLGLAVPEGPPLGSALVSKLELFVSSILLPVYFVITGARIDFTIISLKAFGVVELLAVFGFIWKMMGTMVPCFYCCKMCVNDAVSLALIMSVQGITEVLLIGRAADLQYIDKESHSILVISLVLFTATVTPIVKWLYKPSKRYITYKRRTIQHAKPGAELRMLACIYHEDHTPCVINLLEASNPSSNSPICFYLVHLMELSGRSAPVLVVHQVGKTNSFNSNNSDHVINAFRLYEQQNTGTVIVNPYTALSPYATMHDEVCALALDKKISLVILPFHRFRTIHGTEESANAVRVVNKNILRMAPCSVGIVVDRGTLGSTTSKLPGEVSYNIAVIFLGGQDDRESLAYANRMVKHPNVSLTVFRITDYSTKKYKTMSEEIERDFDSINAFKISNAGNVRCIYKEEVVNDSVGMVSVIRAMENAFDLIMVGRRHNNDDSDLLLGLRDWNEFPELGFIGDMLASSDSNCSVSVMVVQQQNFVGGDILVDSPKSTVVLGDFSAVDMPKDNRVWPVHFSNE